MPGILLPAGAEITDARVAEKIHFLLSVPQQDRPQLYREHFIFYPLSLIDIWNPASTPLGHKSHCWPLRPAPTPPGYVFSQEGYSDRALPYSLWVPLDHRMVYHVLVLSQTASNVSTFQSLILAGASSSSIYQDFLLKTSGKSRRRPAGHTDFSLVPASRTILLIRLHAVGLCPLVYTDHVASPMDHNVTARRETDFSARL